MSKDNTIHLDATSWKSRDDFYTSYCNVTGAPTWFGKNLDALADSFVGGICRITPEKIVVRNLTARIKASLGDKFWLTVQEICQEHEVKLETHYD